MKHFIVFCCSVVMIFAVARTVEASAVSTHSFVAPNLLNTMNGPQCYLWGINWNVPTNEHIVGASQVFNDLQPENESNVLYVPLLGSAAPLVMTGNDTPESGDAFDGIGVKLFEWENLSTTSQKKTYNFDTNNLDFLTDYLTDGNIGFGLDPDAGYSTTAITLNVETANAPIPGAAWLLGSGLIRRDRNQKKTKPVI